MTQIGEFWQFMRDKGQIEVPCLLMEKYQTLDIAPEELGYLLLAFFRQRQYDAEAARLSREEPYNEKSAEGEDPWIGWALEKGWAGWKGEGSERRVVFEPLWQKLYQVWKEELKERVADEILQSGFADGFDYSRVVKELDKLRGSLSVTVREKQLIQEFNLKYGWSTDFIINFFRLCGTRDLIQMKNYKPIAAQIHRGGIYTLDGLTSFMNEVDWTSKQAAEIKRDYLGLYGMVTVMERDYYVKWHITWRFSHAMIVRAARESAGAANATFKYIDTIMERWRDLGVDSLEACEEAIRSWNEEKRKTGSTDNRRAPGRASRKKYEKERDASIWNGFLEGEEP